MRKDKEEAKTKNITDENDSFLCFLRAVDSALDLFHEVVGGNRFERFGRHIFFLFFCARGGFVVVSRRNFYVYQAAL